MLVLYTKLQCSYFLARKDIIKSNIFLLGTVLMGGKLWVYSFFPSTTYTWNSIKGS